MAEIKVYTRKQQGEQYPHALANSVHFSFSEGEQKDVPLNHNYGMLFAMSEILPDNTINEKELTNPLVAEKDGLYYIFAIQLDKEGKVESEDTLILWTTKDFVVFSNQKLVDKKEYKEVLAYAGATITISDELLQKIKDRWYPLYSVEVESPCYIEEADLPKLSGVKATVIYSDGSTDKKTVQWNHAGKGIIDGRIVERPLVFPRAVGLADPVIFHWEGAWYFLATNDNVDDIGLFVRKADTVDGLFAEGIETKCILDYNEEKNYIQTFWAPEFHVIGNDLYILFAVGGKQWAPQCHMMKLKKGGEIANPDSWEEPVRVCRQDGGYLATDGITLDMTYFKVKNQSYLVWSYRYGIGTDKDTGSMLMIATTDEHKPWILTSEPVLLSRPLFGWENIGRTINNEGPYPLVLKDKVYIAYSGGSACGYSYAVGYLSASVEDDLMEVANWRKEPAPLLASTYIDGIEGPGHNSFFYDEEGRLMIAYHAQETRNYHKRCSTFHRVHIGKNGFPFLDVSGERDLAENLRDIRMEIVG